MAVVVRPVDLVGERQTLIDFLGKHLTAVDHRKRFDWLYRGNPVGTAWAWFVIEQQTKEIVGAASLFPRAVWVGKDVKRCGQVGDFAIDAKYRSLGPALLLQRATFQPVQQGHLEFCYDCPPHALGMSTFKRIGLNVSCPMVSYVRLIRADRQVIRFLGDGVIGRAASSIANAMLALRISRRREEKGVEIAVHAGLFGDEFSDLDRRTRHDVPIRGRRAAKDLNWRYQMDPLTEYQVLTARRRGEIEAYLVFIRRADDAYVIDLFTGTSTEIAVGLLHAAAESARAQRAQTLRMFVGAHAPARACLNRAGLVYRTDAMNVVAYAESTNPIHPLLCDPRNWDFNYGDIIA